ncbi:MAG: hypothetical protein MK171_07950 [Pirellulales bacterium]|nr:hypothetical protein [Pirellulales bacterium]
MTDYRVALDEGSLPVGSQPESLQTPHFPDRLHALVWRNWQLVEPSHLAAVVGTKTENITRIATSMGLPAAPPVEPHMLTRGSITIIRRNWHLLSYDQLLLLLGMSAKQLAFTLNEEDFLFIKLGSLKPKCEPLRYREPDSRAQKRAAEIKRLVARHLGDQRSQSAEPRFHFSEQFGPLDLGDRAVARPTEANQQSLRFIHSYFGSLGDALSDANANPYPESLLARLAEAGVNGVWMHVILRQLAPGGEHFSEFGAGHRERLANLRRLVEKTKKFGIGIYLYINEPRAMPPDFFKNRPEMAGIRSRGLVTMCSSDPRVRQWIRDALEHLFREVPDLAGVFTITASENPTNCAFAEGQSDCPRCQGRSQAEIVAEVNAAIEEGVHRGNASARVICSDWGWNSHGDASEIIAKLPARIELMSVSEWSIPIQRGGVATQIGEYSISAVGPGPRAARHWALAKQRGLKTVAKVQLNNSWELSAVPFLPVLDLVAEHCQNLAAAEVDGTMLSWSLGGYPSPNLQVAHLFRTLPGANKETVLDAIATDRYGAAAAPHARHAWTDFSNAFREFPFDIDVLYFAPQHMGPANLLYNEPTGYQSTMVGIPYDDVDRWRGVYPAEVLAKQFEKMATAWETGLTHLKKAVEAAPEDKHRTAELDLGLAQAVYLHFASTGNQIRFVLTRDTLGQPGLSSIDRQKLSTERQRILDHEIMLATKLFALAQKDSRIGFEASNHYFYVPIDLMEKVINCDFLLK